MSVNLKESYTVKIIGFSEIEQKLLTNVFGLSSRRVPKFVQHPLIDTPPDIFLVDAAEPSAVAQLAEQNAPGLIPAILIGETNCGTDWPVLARPIRWMKLFQAFDTAITAQPETLPEQVSAAGDATSPTAANVAPSVQTVAQAEQVAATESPAAEITPVDERVSWRNKLPEADWVLVVDDNLTVREFMKSKLSAFNFNVDFAESGEQAIGYTGQKHYACIFLDVIMPGIDGYQVCKLIKSNRAVKKTAVVMLTSKDSPFDKIRGSMAGCDAYLTKPVDEEKLLETVAKYLPTRNQP